MKKNTLILALIFFAYSFIHAQQSAEFDPSAITIVRDSFGVPHIFAKTDAEVAYGLAWATAEDDGENAQFFITAMRGLLGKRQGVDGAKVDYAIQLLDVMNYVDERYEAETPEDFKRVLEGYCAGVNAYMEKFPERVWFKKSFPVRPQDLVAGHMLAMALMGGVEGTINKIINGDIIKQLPPELEDGIGSNAFAFNSAKTKDGNTYLAVNAHQPVEGLLSWYEAHLCSEEGWNIIGAFFHGSPVIYLGSNEYLGWAHTTGQLDEKDVFKLTMHPRKKNLYKFDGEWLELEQSVAKLRVGLGKNNRFILPVRKKYWKSVYGPTLKTNHGVYAIGMPALIDLNPALQWYRMNKAKNFSEFRKALEIQGLSRQNITYADRYDTIFFISNGIIPVRNPNYNWSKVVPGDTSSTLWKEYLPLDSLAYFINPECGYVFNTNNAGFDATCETENATLPQFNPHIGYKEEYNNRSLRFYELMDEEYANVLIDFDDFKEIKFDHQFPKRPTYRGDFWLDDLFTLDEAKYPYIADAISRMKNFDLKADTLDRNYPIFMYTIYMMLNADGKERKAAEEDSLKRIEFYVNCITRAKEHMIKHFGTIDVPTAKVQVLERNGIALGVAGGPDAIRAVYGTFMEDGRVRMQVGDGYVQLTKFTKDGPEIYSISAFGASSFPDSPHYTDQMEMFVKHRLKPMTLDKEKVFEQAKSIYHPE